MDSPVSLPGLLLATRASVLRYYVAEVILLFGRLERFPLRARPLTTCFNCC